MISADFKCNRRFDSVDYFLAQQPLAQASSLVLVETSFAADSLQQAPLAQHAPSAQQVPVLQQQSSGRHAMQSQVAQSHGAFATANEASTVAQQLVAFEQHEPAAIEQEDSCELIPM